MEHPPSATHLSGPKCREDPIYWVAHNTGPTSEWPMRYQMALDAWKGGGQCMAGVVGNCVAMVLNEAPSN